MNTEAKRVVLYSLSGYNQKHDSILENLIDEKILLFCAVGKDCELWHDIMDELFVGFGEERDFFMITTFHKDETFDEVIQFAEMYNLEGITNYKIKVIQI